MSSVLLLLQALGWIGLALCAWFRPLAGEPLFEALEQRLAQLARRPLLCCATLGAFVLLFRAALLPLWPIPPPAVHDEFSYLLMADTFAHGRLANPPHPLWSFFETTHVLSQPVYASKFFPGQGLFLAAGQVVFGHPWFGVWLSCGLMAAATLWCAFGWLPANWALLAGALTLPMAIHSYWMNSFWGGAVTATGGALAVGAATRLIDRSTTPLRHAAILATGSILLCLTRPFEGLVLLVPLFLYIIGKTWGNPPVRAWLLVAALGAGGAAFLLHYNARLTGSPWVAPEEEFQRQYGSAPLFIFGQISPPKILPDAHMDYIHNVWEPDLIRHGRSPAIFLDRILNAASAAVHFAGDNPIFLLPLAALLLPVLRQRTGILVCLMLWGPLASLVEMTYFAHYGSPFFAITVICAAEGFRQLRGWQPPMGRFLTRTIPMLGFAVVTLTAAVNWVEAHGPDGTFLFSPLPSASRERLERSMPAGRHVVLVRYEPPFNVHAQWIYNHADIDASDVVWARDMGPVENKRLQSYYPDRKFWILFPNQDPEWLKPYP
jgi:hypothetical protein